MKNKVFLDKEGVIHSVCQGPQTVEKLEATTRRIMRIAQVLVGQDHPVRILNDIRGMGQSNQQARLIELHMMTILPFWKMAVVTAADHPPSEQVSRQLTSMSARKSEIRYFQREDDAIGWLSFMRGRGNPRRTIPIK